VRSQGGGVVGQKKRPANPRMHATWLIGALFNVSTHIVVHFGEGAHAAPAKRVMRNVMRTRSLSEQRQTTMRLLSPSISDARL
jgi:hypothetical protein